MKKNNKKGFTLVELVIVVAVMAILVAVAIPAISTITDTAEEQVIASNCRTIESLMKLAEAEAEAEGTTTAYEQKLYESKLGIEPNDDGYVYWYDTQSGKVTYSGSDDATAPEKGYTITFEEMGEVTDEDKYPGVSVVAIEEDDE